MNYRIRWSNGDTDYKFEVCATSQAGALRCLVDMLNEQGMPNILPAGVYVEIDTYTPGIALFARTFNRDWHPVF